MELVFLFSFFFVSNANYWLFYIFNFIYIYYYYIPRWYIFKFPKFQNNPLFYFFVFLSQYSTTTYFKPKHILYRVIVLPFKSSGRSVFLLSNIEHRDEKVFPKGNSPFLNLLVKFRTWKSTFCLYNSKSTLFSKSSIFDH